MDRAELRAWMRLLLTPRVGLLTARKLLAAMGSPQAVFDAPLSVWTTVVGAREAKALLAEPEGLDAQADDALAWLASAEAGAPPRAILSLADPRYPSALLEAADPPLLFFALGDLRWLAQPAVAMVGSRHPTPQGREHALAFAEALSQAGLTVVSGLAEGIDGAAHEGALKGHAQGGAGSTVAVVGTGLDRVYPAKHQALARQIAQQGLLLSEFMIGTPPLMTNFPKRNRVVAALSRGTLVVEAALQSGSLITARLAAEMGREVMAIPGSIHAPQARGCHALIKQGAMLVESSQDVLDALTLLRSASGLSARTSAGPVGDGPGAQGRLAMAAPRVMRSMNDAFPDALADVPPNASPNASPNALPEPSPPEPLLAVMGYEPVSQDALAARTGLAAAELSARLLVLELEGQVARLPGQLFQRQARA